MFLNIFFGCFLSLLVPLVRPVSSWRMGWSPPLSTTSSRKDRPRWPRPKGSQFSWTSWCISVQVKTRRYSQGNYWYQTEETLDTAQHCWCGSTNVGRFLFTRASCWLMVTRRLVWIWAPFIVSIYAEFFDDFFLKLSKFYIKQPSRCMVICLCPRYSYSSEILRCARVAQNDKIYLTKPGY